MKKYDVTPFYNELDVLDFRLHHVYDHVDYVVIVEGDRTYPGKKYDSMYLANKDRYKWAEDKIIHVTVPLKENPVDRWENEAIQHDGTIMGFMDAQPDDLIFWTVGVDEIIKHEYYHRDYDVPHCLSLDNYYYYFNGKDIGEKPDHPMPMVFKYKHLDTNVQTFWERRHGFPTINSAGWHFSYLGGIDLIKQKLEAYSHVENDTDEVKAKLEENIKAGKDIFGRPDHEFEFVKIDETFPDELVKNQEKYKHLIYEVKE
jgi:hypothetical protein